MRELLKVLKNQLGGDRGSIELGSIFLFFAIFSLCLLINQRISLWNTEINQRIDSLLCFKRIMQRHDSLFKNIKLSNRAISIANASFISTGNPVFLKVKKAAQGGQNILIALYLGKNTLETKCKISQKLLLARAIPLLLPIKRNISGRILFKKRKVNLLFPLTYSPSPHSFLKGVLTFKNDFIFSQAKEYSIL